MHDALNGDQKPETLGSTPARANVFFTHLAIVCLESRTKGALEVKNRYNCPSRTSAVFST